MVRLFDFIDFAVSDKPNASLDMAMATAIRYFSLPPIISDMSVRSLLLQLFGPSSAFSAGDSVVLSEEGHLMVVQGTTRDKDTNDLIVQCVYFDPVEKISVMRTFPEKELKPM